MATTNAFINSLLEAAFGGGTYTGGTITMKLFKTGLPSTTGVEVTGGGYSAQTLSFGAAASKRITTSADATFTNLPTDTIVAYGIYNDGTLIDERTLTTPFTADVTNNTLDISYYFEITGS